MPLLSGLQSGIFSKWQIFGRVEVNCHLIKVHNECFGKAEGDGTMDALNGKRFLSW